MHKGHWSGSGERAMEKVIHLCTPYANTKNQTWGLVW